MRRLEESRREMRAGSAKVASENADSESNPGRGRRAPGSRRPFAQGSCVYFTCRDSMYLTRLVTRCCTWAS